MTSYVFSLLEIRHADIYYLIYTMNLKKDNISYWTTKTDYNERECVEKSVFNFLYVGPEFDGFTLYDEDID